jgi:hypothetical protein
MIAKSKLAQKAELPRRRPHSSKPKAELGHGNWKLVYADFVTVLMAFFLVVWIILFEKVSKIPEKDMACINQLAVNLQQQIAPPPSFLILSPHANKVLIFAANAHVLHPVKSNASAVAVLVLPTCPTFREVLTSKAA